MSQDLLLEDFVSAESSRSQRNQETIEGHIRSEMEYDFIMERNRDLLIVRNAKAIMSHESAIVLVPIVNMDRI
jgi:hypothetical protein